MSLTPCAALPTVILSLPAPPSTVTGTVAARAEDADLVVARCCRRTSMLRTLRVVAGEAYWILTWLPLQRVLVSQIWRARDVDRGRCRRCRRRRSGRRSSTGRPVPLVVDLRVDRVRRRAAASGRCRCRSPGRRRASCCTSSRPAASPRRRTCPRPCRRGSSPDAAHVLDVDLVRPGRAGLRAPAGDDLAALDGVPDVLGAAGHVEDAEPLSVGGRDVVGARRAPDRCSCRRPRRRRRCGRCPGRGSIVSAPAAVDVSLPSPPLSVASVVRVASRAASSVDRVVADAAVEEVVSPYPSAAGQRVVAGVAEQLRADPRSWRRTSTCVGPMSVSLPSPPWMITLMSGVVEPAQVDVVVAGAGVRSRSS